MKRLVGTLLILVGAAIIAYALYGVFQELAAIYAHALDDALARPEIAEQERPARIFKRLAVALVGLVPLVAGTILVTIARVRARRARTRRR